jgi:hypothetical protein
LQAGYGEPYFGWNEVTSNISGFDEGSWNYGNVFANEASYNFAYGNDTYTNNYFTGTGFVVPLFDQAFDLDTAEGVQLDVIGEIVGIGRDVDFVLTSGGSSRLRDDDYRKVIKAKIGKNLWDGQADSLQELWKTLEPNVEIALIDGQDMSMNVNVFGNSSSLLKDLVNHGYIVPKPQTVRINTILYAHDLPAFGYGMNTSYVSGFNIGTWESDSYWSDNLLDTNTPLFAFGSDDDSLSGFDIGRWGSGVSSSIGNDVVVTSNDPWFGWNESSATVSGFTKGIWKTT